MNAHVQDAPADTFGERLNPAQYHAATYGGPSSAGFSAGPLLIIAGAGTGKTNTLAHRVAHLLLKGVAPERILLLTFTRRAAQEMLRRAERIAHTYMKVSGSSSDGQARLLWSGTYHSIGNRLLREYAQVVGLEPSFSVLDRGDAADLLDFLRQELGLAKKEKRFPRKDTCLAIYSHRVNSRQPLARTLEEVFPWCSEWGDELTQLFRRYVEVKHAQQLLDYDDLLLYWHILVQEERVAREIGGRFEHVLVDEYQDTNTLQAEILLAMKPNGVGVCVVGDDAQAIYSFRAATIDNILEFPERFTPAAQIVKLEQNYRSVQPILDAANVLMSDSPRQYQKQLRSEQARRRQAAVRRRARRSGAGALRRRASAGGARAGNAVATPGRACAQLASQRHARARAAPSQHSVREIRRPEVSRSRAREGCARAAALGRQPAQSHRRLPRPAAAARRGAGDGRSLPEGVRGERLRVADACRVPHAGGGGSRMVVADGADGRPDERARVARTARPTAQVVRAAARAHLRRGARFAPATSNSWSGCPVSTRRASSS